MLLHELLSEACAKTRQLIGWEQDMLTYHTTSLKSLIEKNANQQILIDWGRHTGLTEVWECNVESCSLINRRRHHWYIPYCSEYKTTLIIRQPPTFQDAPFAEKCFWRPNIVLTYFLKNVKHYTHIKFPFENQQIYFTKIVDIAKGDSRTSLWGTLVLYQPGTELDQTVLLHTKTQRFAILLHTFF